MADSPPHNPRSVGRNATRWFRKGALAFVIVLFVLPYNGLLSRVELAIAFCLVWLCSLLPILWAYPGSYVFADQLWSTLFALLALLSFSAAGLLRTILRRRRPDIDEPRAEQPRRPQIVAR